jgi:hypothetical protein
LFLVTAKTGEVAIIIVAIKAKAVLIGKSSLRVERQNEK